jgi:DNA replication protein DnaC
MDQLSNELQKVVPQKLQTQSTNTQEKSQSIKENFGKTNKKCSCNVVGANGMKLPCDLVPHTTRITELESKFLRENKCTCEGLEWVGFHFPITHMDFGQVVKCICSRTSSVSTRKEILVKMSNLHEKKTFTDFNLSLNPNCKDAHDMCLEWSRGEGTSMLTLYGRTGVGKTHLAIASAWVTLGMEKPVLFYSSSELIRDLQRAVGDGELDTLVSQVKSAQNLVLDDLGREYTTGWTTAIFHEIIDYRYNNNINLRTLITTNHSLEELEKIVGKPIVSRLTDHMVSSLAIMDGVDVRSVER